MISFVSVFAQSRGDFLIILYTKNSLRVVKQTFDFQLRVKMKLLNRLITKSFNLPCLCKSLFFYF